MTDSKRLNVLFGIYATVAGSRAQDSAYRKRCAGVPYVNPMSYPLAKAVLSTANDSSLNRYIALVCGVSAFGDRAADILTVDPNNTYERPSDTPWLIQISSTSDASAIYAALSMYGDDDIKGSLAHTGWVEAVQAASLQLLRWLKG